MYKNWGYRLDRRGYVILFLIILSGILIAPVLVYTYNGGSALLRQDEVQDVRTFSFMLNGSNPLQEFHESIDTTGTSSFVRIAELDTNRTPVSITVNADEDTQTLHLSNITVYPSSPIQIELPRENITGFTLQFDWIVQNASISFSIETVNNVWAPRIDPMPNTQSGLIGLSILMISLALPRNSETRLPDNSSLS
jgi:hypothetical protein